MIYYNENPDLGIKVVTLADGSKEYRKNCKRIKSEYYVIGKDCFEVEGKWYHKDSGLIIHDYETKEWVLTAKAKSKLVYGVVGFEPGHVIMGYYTPNPYNNCEGYYNGGRLRTISSALLADNGFLEDVSTGFWHNRKDLRNSDIASLARPRNRVNHGNKGYNIEDNADEFVNKIKLYDEYKHQLSKDVRKYARMLGDTSFGIEMECSQGYLPEYLQNRTGVVICRDGSLDGGPEFTTIPLRGSKGLQNVKDLCNYLSPRTSIDSRCALHIHLGSIPTTRIYLVSLYLLCQSIQDEIFLMFPGYKIHWEGIKRKNYNQKLQRKILPYKKKPRPVPIDPIKAVEIPGTKKPSTDKREDFEKYIDEAYSNIFTFLSEGQPAGVNYNRKNKTHPAKQKWDRHNRYFWVNLMNTIFSDRNTVEFRLHTPTTNAQKTINWLFICNAIVRYAQKHTKDIILANRKITLFDVFDYYKDTFSMQEGTLLSGYLKAYYSERKALFQADFRKQDMLSDWELDQDKEYEFKYGNVTHLF